MIKGFLKKAIKVVPILSDPLACVLVAYLLLTGSWTGVSGEQTRRNKWYEIHQGGMAHTGREEEGKSICLMHVEFLVISWMKHFF